MLPNPDGGMEGIAVSRSSLASRIDCRRTRSTTGIEDDDCCDEQFGVKEEAGNPILHGGSVPERTT